MALPTPMPEPMIEMIASRFHLLGEPMRVRALDRLRSDGEASVGELADALGTSQQNVSKHLGALRAGGVVSRRRDGNRVLYSIADQSVIAICEAICGSVERQVSDLSAALEGVAA